VTPGAARNERTEGFRRGGSGVRPTDRPTDRLVASPPALIGLSQKPCPFDASSRRV
jgi:hypothetical protein